MLAGSCARRPDAERNRLLDDLARVAQGALGAFTGMREELETRLKEQCRALLGRMNLVRREEFDAVQAMAAKARRARRRWKAGLPRWKRRLGRKPRKQPAPQGQG